MYVAMGLIAPFSLIYVPRTLIVQGNAAATASNVLDHEMPFRLGIGTLGMLFLGLRRQGIVVNEISGGSGSWRSVTELGLAHLLRRQVDDGAAVGESDIHWY